MGDMKLKELQARVDNACADANNALRASIDADNAARAADAARISAEGKLAKAYQKLYEYKNKIQDKP